MNEPELELECKVANGSGNTNDSMGVEMAISESVPFINNSDDYSHPQVFTASDKAMYTVSMEWRRKHLI